MRGVERQSAPIAAAAGERIDQGALGAGRGEQSFAACRLDCVAAFAAVPEGKTESIIRRDLAGRQGWRRNGKRLGWRQSAAGRGALRYLAFLHRDQGLSGFAVQGK